MAITLPDARELSNEVLEALRLRALHGCEMGLTEAEVADLLGVCRETVSRWWSAYAEGGLDALPHDRTGRPRGSGRVLSEAQGEQIQTLLRTRQPEQMNIAAPLWTRRAVAELIQHQFGITVAIRTVGTYLARWGFTCKVPRRHARRQDPAEVERWLNETYPAIVARAAQEQAVIFWADETGAAADHQPARGYAPRGEEARLDVPDPHVRASQISAITNEGDVRFMTYTTTMNATLFITFLERLVRGSEGKVFLIVDRLRAHLTPAVDQWVAAHHDRLEIFPLPRYAPERNPDEYLNHDLKENIHATGLPDTQEEERSRLQDFMQTLLHLPERVMSYFRHPAVAYASPLL